MPENVGIYYRDDEVDELHSFDKIEKRHQKGAYSRSAAVRRAMEMHRMILEVLEEKGWPEDMDPRERRFAVRGAVLELGEWEDR